MCRPRSNSWAIACTTGFLIACASAPQQLGTRPIEIEDPAPLEGSLPPATEGNLPLGTPELSEGRCGGFADMSTGPLVPVLVDRVRLPSLMGADLVGGVPGHTLGRPDMDWFSLEAGDQRFAARVTEVYLRAGPSLAETINNATLDEDEDRAEVVPFTDARGTSKVLVFLFPSGRLSEDEGSPTPLLDLYVRTPDELVVRIRFFASSSAVAQGGCERLAVRLAQNAVAGEGRLDLDGGDSQLLPGVAARLPPDHALTFVNMHHWLEFRIHRIFEVGTERSSLLIRFDPHPGREEAPGTRTTMAPAFGQDAQWRTWRAGGRRLRDTIVPGGPFGSVLFGISAADDEALDALSAVAASVGYRTAESSLLPCERVSSPPPSPPPTASGPESAASAAGQALSFLSRAERFDTSAAVFGEPRPRTLNAFRTLLALPPLERANVFRRLAESGTVAGRLYGLAGLYFADPEAFDSVACAVRSTLGSEARIEVGTECGPEPQDPRQLIDFAAPSAIRGESYWGPYQWSAATGEADLRGGALAYRLWIQAIEGQGSPLRTTGYVPSLSAEQAPPEPLTAGPPAALRSGAPNNHRFCWTRRDGRIVCAEGGVPRRLLPDMVRHPAALVSAPGATCVLDGAGRRACTGGIEPDLRQRQQRCGTPVPSGPVYRIFEDGPWSELVWIGQVCGIRQEDGSLHCFANSGHFDAHRINVEGRVVGGGEGQGLDGHGAGYAFTGDGALWQWERNPDQPRIVARFEEPVVEITRFNEVDFLRLQNGRVFARGVAESTAIYQRGDVRDHPQWIPIEALQGARVFTSSATACILGRDGEVHCWSACRSHTSNCPPPRQWPNLAGASELFLGDNFRCGLRDDNLTCIGRGTSRVFGGGAQVGFREFDLQSLGRRARETTGRPPARRAASRTRGNRRRR